MTNQTPYRNIPSTDLMKREPKRGFFCKTFGCKGNANDKEGLWYFQNILPIPEIHFYNCMICGNEYSKIGKNQLVLYYEGTSLHKKYMYITSYGTLILTKNINHISDIPNFQFNKFKYKFICSKIGCKPKRFKDFSDPNLDISLEFCGRCKRLL